MKVALVTGAELLLKLLLMHRQQLRKKVPRSHSSRFTMRASGLPMSYLKTRLRGSRLQNSARLLALIELSRRLHQAYRHAYDKQASDQLLPQNPQLPRPNTTVSFPDPHTAQIDFASQIARNVLSGNNSCSQFFQGSTGAIAALGALTSVLEARLFINRPGLGISMRFNLPYTLASAGGTTYRVPSSALVNTQGIFFFGITFLGPFSSDSTAGQVLQVLHEVAHLIRQPNGNWLIFNDGMPGGTSISKANTAVVAAHCSDAIKAALGIRPITVNIGPPPPPPR